VILNTRHAGVVVRNIDKSLRFYQDILGLKIRSREKEEGSFIDKVTGIKKVCVETCKMTGPDDSMIELLQYHSHPANKPLVLASSNNLGCSHVAFTVSDLDKVYSLLKENNLNCVNPPATSPNGLVKVLYCHDFDGVIIELVEELEI
jgi:catechol 2,3-dioxygenase-like lactoylglutathione lyase family enzyme